MKTLIVTCSDLTEFDGKSLRLIKYADVLEELGYKVDFIVLRNHLLNKKFTINETNIKITDFFGNTKYKPFISETSNVIKLIKFGLVVLNKIIKNDYKLIITSAVSPEIAQIFSITGCKIKGIKHVYDYDDLAPEMSMVMKGWKSNHPLLKIQLFIEKLICSKSFKTIVMSDLMKDKIARATSLSDVEVIYNAPFYNDIIIQPVADARERLGINKQKFIFCYIGNIQRKIRSLEIIVDTAEIIAKENFKFQILIIGHGSGSYLLQQYIAKKGLTDYFVFTGPIDKNKVINYVNASNISLVLLPDSELGDYMAPGKLFVSMGLGKNIIATNTAQVERILKDKAIYVKPDPSTLELADAMKQAIQKYSLNEINYEFIESFKKNYNWDVEKIKFLKILNQIYRSNYE